METTKVGVIKSAYVVTAGEIAPAQSRERLGMRRLIHSMRIPREAIGYADPAVKAQEWAEAAMAESNATLPDGALWEQCSVTAHNYGWSATFARWEPAGSTADTDPDQH